MYSDIKAKSPDHNFEIFSGIMQGDTIAQYLFVIRIHPEEDTKLSAISLTDRDFADDIALLSDDIEQARPVLRNVETEGGKVGVTECKEY